jgi:hypothetical protein
MNQVATVAQAEYQVFGPLSQAPLFIANKPAHCGVVLPLQVASRTTHYCLKNPLRPVTFGLFPSLSAGSDSE